MKNAICTTAGAIGGVIASLFGGWMQGWQHWSCSWP